MKQWLKSFVHNVVVHPMMMVLPKELANMMHDTNANWAFGLERYDEMSLEEKTQTADGVASTLNAELAVKIEKYVKEWHKFPMGVQPCNEPIFIKYFTDFLRQAPAKNFRFKGNNEYDGYTAILWVGDPSFEFCGITGFEIAYDKDFIKVFTAYHGGFIYPEYISLCKGEAKELLDILKEKLIAWAGFDC